MASSLTPAGNAAAKRVETRADILRVAIALGLLAALASFDSAEERGAPHAELAANAAADSSAE